MKKVVGTNTIDYPQIRNFASFKYDNYIVQKKQNLFKIPAYLTWKLFDRTNDYFINAFQDFGLNNCDLYHFFNAISYGKTPWITTFETFIPRWGNVSQNKLRKGVELLAGPHCKQLIALSQCTANIQSLFLADGFSEFREEIMSKTQVIHPAQQALVSSYEQKELPETIKLVFIGDQVFRKGGREALQSVAALHKNGAKIELHIISGMYPDEYASATDERDVALFKSDLETNRDCVVHHGRLPNSDVMKMLIGSHALILPTYADSYGYVVLEAQACGCPVISTDVRALPEINTSEAGWLIEVPKDSWGNAQLNSIEERSRLQSVILEGLRNVLTEIVEQPELLEEKGRLALERIKTHHNPGKKAKLIENIYDRALRK